MADVYLSTAEWTPGRQAKFDEVADQVIATQAAAVAIATAVTLSTPAARETLARLNQQDGPIDWS